MNKNGTDKLADRLAGLVAKLVVFNAKITDFDQKWQNQYINALLISLEGHNMKLFTY